jgi:hypothetical protein
MATKPDIYNGIPRNGGGKPPASTALTNTPAQKARLMTTPPKSGSHNAAGMLPPSQPKAAKQGVAVQKMAPAQGNAASTRMLAPSQPAKNLPLRMNGPAGKAAGQAVGKAMTKGMKSAKGAFNKMKGRGKKVPI